MAPTALKTTQKQGIFRVHVRYGESWAAVGEEPTWFDALISLDERSPEQFLIVDVDGERVWCSVCRAWSYRPADARACSCSGCGTKAY